MEQILATTPELSSISSKGQIVIPQSIRKHLHIQEGDVFATMTTRKGLIVLKKIDDILLREKLSLLKDIEDAWKEVEQGKSKTFSKDTFLEEIKTW